MDEKQEWLKCMYSPVYFARYVSIYNATVRRWIPFELWPAQQSALADIATHRYIVMLKARQLGMSWLTLTYALWMMVFRPAPNIMLMSKRDDESIELLTRLIQMYEYLPDWMKVKAIVQSSAHDFVLSNGSKAKAFPTSGGRSYTGTMVILDEADFMPDLNKVLNAIRPTVDAGGQLVMISTVDKEKPISPFKEIFRASYYDKQGDYHAIFLDWRARPERTEEWRAKIAIDMRKQTGTNDGLYQEYPDNPEEALAPIEAAKRIPFEWIKKCYKKIEALSPPGAPAVPSLTIYKEPIPNRHYVIGADPAEGNPNSDDSAGNVLDADTWEEVAVFAGKWEPKVFGGFIDQVGVYYNYASVMPERNNHGHALILALRDTGILTILRGHSADAEKEQSTERFGWLSNEKGKTLMYDNIAQLIMDESIILHDPKTINQLASIESKTKRAPDGMNDDAADALTLAAAALQYRDQFGEPSIIIHAPDPLIEYDKGKW